MSVAPIGGISSKNDGSDPDDARIEEIKALVQDAKMKLDAWANGKTEKERSNAFLKLGMNEGLFTALNIAALDTNGDGKISNDEVERYEDDCKALIESHLSSLMNGGVISALILSVIYSTAYEFEFASGTDVQIFFSYCEYVCCHAAVAFSLGAVLMAAQMFTQISFFMPTTRLRMWYIDQCTYAMPLLETLKNWSVFLLVFILLFHSFATINNEAYLVSLLSPIVVFSINVYFFGWFLETRIKPILRVYSKNLLEKGFNRSQNIINL